MIAKLTGLVDCAGDGHAVIDVGGVGYLVFCSARTLARLRRARRSALLIETHVREDAHPSLRLRSMRPSATGSGC